MSDKKAKLYRCYKVTMESQGNSNRIAFKSAECARDAVLQAAAEYDMIPVRVEPYPAEGGVGRVYACSQCKEFFLCSGNARAERCDPCIMEARGSSSRQSRELPGDAFGQAVTDQVKWLAQSGCSTEQMEAALELATRVYDEVNHDAQAMMVAMFVGYSLGQQAHAATMYQRLVDSMAAGYEAAVVHEPALVASGALPAADEGAS